jgi:RHS repeat-associated protein
MFSYSNLGPKWTFNWLSYVTDDGAAASVGAVVYLRGGGGEEYERRRDTRERSLGINYQSQAELVALGPANQSGFLVNITGYERRLPDGSREIFGLPEPLAGISDRERRVFLTEVSDPMGNSVKLTYDSSFRVVAITDAVGQVTRISYELPGDPLKITKVTDPFGRFATFSYNSQGLIKITDVVGIVSEFTYDGDFVNSLVTPYGTTRFRTGQLDIDPTHQRFREQNRWLEATDPLGETERVELRSNNDGWRNLPSAMSFYWDKQAWRAGGRNDANARTYRWMLLDHTKLSGIVRIEKAALESERVFSYPGQVPEGQLFDNLRVPAAGADGLPATLSSVVEGALQTQRFEYNVRGNVIRSIDPVGRTFVFDYDSSGIDLQEVRNEKTGDRLVQISYNSQHLPVSLTDAGLQTTHLTYNQRGQVLSVTNARQETITFSYDSTGYLTAVTGPVPQAVVRYTYDAFGQVATVTGSDDYRLAFQYDAIDRPTRIIYPDGSFEEIRYNRLDPVEFVDRGGRIRTIQYDAVRRPVSVTDPLRGITRMNWCNCGAVSELIDPVGNVTTWRRDVAGRLIEKALPDGATTRYVYRPNSNRLQQVIDPKGQVTNYEYTVDDNVSRISFENAVVPTAPITFTYDSSYDRLASVQDGVGSTMFNYHAVRTPGALQLASVTGPLPDVRIDYGYDQLGRNILRSINGVASTVRYDSLGRIDRLTNALGQFALNYVNATNRLDTVLYPNGQQTRFGYYDNSGDRLLHEIRHEGPRGDLLAHFYYEYDGVREIRVQGRNQPAFPRPLSAYFYSYDDASQLTRAVLGAEDGSILATNDYAYDAAGNRTVESINGDPQAAAYNADNQLVRLQRGDRIRDFIYDANGNVVNDGVRTFEWDARDRLVAINQGTRRSQFFYDAFDRRVRIIETSSSQLLEDTWLLWCGDQICEERARTTDGSSFAMKRFSSFGETVGERSLFYARDHLGSVRALTQSDGSLAGGTDYSPWGSTSAASGTTQPSFSYTGHWRHAASGLLLAQYRAYDPDLGRWLSRDPIAEDGGTNLYSYAASNPVRYVDPDGLEAKQWWDMSPMEWVMLGATLYGQGVGGLEYHLGKAKPFAPWNTTAGFEYRLSKLSRGGFWLSAALAAYEGRFEYRKGGYAMEWMFRKWRRFLRDTLDSAEELGVKVKATYSPPPNPYLWQLQQLKPRPGLATSVVCYPSYAPGLQNFPELDLLQGYGRYTPGLTNWLQLGY